MVQPTSILQYVYGHAIWQTAGERRGSFGAEGGGGRGGGLKETYGWLVGGGWRDGRRQEGGRDRQIRGWSRGVTDVLT